MPYQELHFNSAIFSDEVKYKGDRSKRTLELNNPIYIDKFHVKDLELPLKWCNIVSAETFSIRLNYKEYDAAAPDTTYVSAAVPVGCYTFATFVDALQTALASTTPASSPATGDITSVALAAVTTTFNYGEIQFTFPVSVHSSVVTAGTKVDVTITWPEAWRKILSRAIDDTELTRKFTIEDITKEDSTFTKYELRLVPNYVYLNSNLMTATPWASTHRALGSYASRTILTRVQLDPNYEWKEQIMPWRNPNLDMAFMFDGNGSEFNQLEFWFTDEFGDVIELNNINFSLTLSIFYSNGNK